MNFLRQLLAFLLVAFKPEWGGILYDYANGKMEQLYKYSTLKELQDMYTLIDAARDGGRDFVYFYVSKTGNNEGLFMIESSLNTIWCSAFYRKLVTPDVALKATLEKCRKIADQLGYRKPEDESVKATTDKV